MSLNLTMLASLDARGVVAGAEVAKVAIADLGRAGTSALTGLQAAAERAAGAAAGAGGLDPAGAGSRGSGDPVGWRQVTDNALAALTEEISLVGQSDAARRQALAALEAEIQIRELGRHVTERGAASLRDNARAIAEETLALEDLETAWGVVQRSGEAAIRSLATRLADGDLTGALRSVISEVSELGLQLLAINPLTNALFGTARPTFASVGGLLGPLLGSFDRGGPTGAGRDTDVAGLVHRNEYVFDARSTARIGVGTLEALRASALRGYQSGGLVTAATLPVSGFPLSGPMRANAARSGPDPERPAGDTVIVNITTPDIQSFRASRSQLAGEFARMALRGRRNG